MLKSILGDLFTEDIAKATEGKQFAVINDGSFVPAAKFNEANSAAKELKKQLAERDTQLEQLKGKAAGNADLLKQIDDLKNANIKTQTEYDTRLKQQAKDFAVDKAIADSKGKNPKAIKALLDLEKVSLDGENIIGLSEQIEAIKANDAYLFGDSQPGPVGGGTNPPGGGNKPPDVNEEYEAAMKAGNFLQAIALKNKLFLKQ